MTYGIEDDPRDITRMLAGMNSNMPVKRRSLMDYIENGGDTYETKSGETCKFEHVGIDYLAGVCTEQEKLLLKLPIFISTDPNSEHGGWKVDGRTEVAVLSRILNRRVHSEDRMAVYYADIAELKKVIPGLVFTVFLP